MIQFVPYFVLVYAVGSVVLLWAHQKTRLYPLYILKSLWVGFTILAFAWVLAMSGSKSAEYIQRPTGPMEIFVGQMVDVKDKTGKIVDRELEGGYAGALKEYTGTKPYWVVAFLFMAWATWGLARDSARARMITDEPLGPGEAAGEAGETDEETSERAGEFHFSISGWIGAGVASLALASLLFWGAGSADTAAFVLGMLLWTGFAFAAPKVFHRQGHWFLWGLLALAALPMIGPLTGFQWSRYSYFEENYTYAWNEGHIGEYFINSMIVTITTVAMTTLFGAMAAYTIARRDFAGKNILYGAIIGSIAVPGILIQVPLFLLIKDWGFVVHGYRYSFMDSRLGLSIIYTALSMPFTIFVLAGFFRTLPGSLGEAACIDGCGKWRTFTQVYLPLAMPGIATTGIFNFLGAWNEFNLGMIFMSNPNFKTLPIGLYELQSATQYSAAWAPMFAGIVLLCLPTFLIFLFLQERIVAGLTAGGMKG